MFGLFRKQKAPDGPVEYENTFEVAASADVFFALIDFSNPSNAKTQLGHEIVRTGENTFSMVMTFLPDLRFDLTVEECEPNRRYAYLSPIPEGLGKLKYTRESFEITPNGEDACTVVAKTVGQFEEGMSLREFQVEAGRLAIAIENALLKLKVHAEGGIEDVREFEALQAA